MTTPTPHTPLRSSLAGDPDMAELVDMFLEELPQRLTVLTTAVDAGDIETLRRLAHQLKGAAGGYGFGDASQSQLSSMAGSIADLKTLCERALLGRTH
jgi:HPt (histidine-containing phosphotransfer) domain-containing protein